MKSKFRDAEDREWTIYIDVLGVGDVRRETGFEFGTSLGDDGLAKDFFAMMDNLELIVDVTWVLCRKAAVGRDVDEADFKRAIRGDVFDKLQIAMTEAFADFCPSQTRIVLQGVLATIEQGADAETLEGQVRTFINSLSTSEPSSESTQELIPTDN